MRLAWNTLPAKCFLFPHPADPGGYVVTRERSVLAELANISEYSLEGYPIDSAKGAWFILTGDFIPSDPVRISYTGIEAYGSRKGPGFKRTTIAVEAEGWMSPEEVAEHYRYAQRHVFGKTPRSLDDKSLAVFEFVNRNKERERSTIVNQNKPWEALLREWNKIHPAQRFGQRRHLYQAYQRALRKIAALG